MPFDFDNELHNTPEWQQFVNNRALFGSVYVDSNIPNYLLKHGMRSASTEVGGRRCLARSN